MEFIVDWMSANAKTLIAVFAVAGLIFLLIGIASETNNKFSLVIAALALFTALVIGAVQITGDLIKAPNDYFIYDRVISEDIPEKEIKAMSQNDIQLAINEIYAAHGNIFKTESLNDYFSQKSWYKPVKNITNIEDYFINDYEKKNFKKFVKYRK